MAEPIKIKKDKNSDTPSAKIFWALMYLLLIIVVLISACFIYDRTYYTPFYVDGPSMLPTLNKNVEKNYYEFGIEDEHRSVIKTIKRYDLIITYYNADFQNGETPETHSVDNMPSKKIKRVIGLPHDTITIKNINKSYNEIWLETPETRQNHENDNSEPKEIKLELPFEPINKFGLKDAVYLNNAAKFKAEYIKQGHSEAEASKLANEKALTTDSFSWTLGDNQIFAMGDNWGDSNDCTNPAVGPITYDYISGVVIKIQGYLKIENGIAVDKHYYDDARVYKK